MGIKSEFTRYELYQILRAKDELAYHIPPIGLFDDFDDLLKFIKNYKKVVLKPIDISEGGEICIVQKSENNFKITDCRQKKHISVMMYSKEELREFFKGTENNIDKYIIQKLIKSIRIEQAVFDLRVVMRRSLKGDWRCGELEYKVGGDNFLLTDVCKEVYPAALSKTMKKTYPLKFDFIKAVKEIKKLCAKTCEDISGMLDCENDIEFEVAIDEDNKPWFIEINLFKDIKRFKAVNYETYFLVKGTPLLYSASI